MQALPWLPRPLIVFARIIGVETPCVQWHGQDSKGNITEEQMLFPIHGADAENIECVRPEYWRVSFLGSMAVWNEHNPGQPYALKVGNKVKKGASPPIIRVIANELFSHDTFVMVCSIIQLGERGVLYSPAMYENENAYHELPRHNVDRDLQDEWRKAYKDPACADIKQAIDGMYFADLGCLNLYSTRYARWLREQERLQDEYRYA